MTRHSQQQPTPHETVHHCETIIAKDGRVSAHIDYGGDLLLLPLADGREVVFEMSKWFGPIPSSKKTLDPLARIPRGFWEAYERWDNDGRLVVDCGEKVVWGRCVFRGGGNSDDVIHNGH